MNPEPIYEENVPEEAGSTYEDFEKPMRCPDCGGENLRKSNALGPDGRTFEIQYDCQDCGTLITEK